MKKILGIVALTLIAGVPVFAQNTTAIDYVLQVGGSNQNGPNVPFDTTNVKEEGDPGIYDAGTGIVTWSVKVLASGAIDVGGNLIYIGGASNLVWDLTLLGPDGQPVGTVGTPFGLGSATTAGFYSSIQDGLGLYKLQPAAFTWVFGDAAPFGRLRDDPAANGANAVQYTYPSTYSFYHNDVTDAVYNTTATVLAPTGTLKGMGAGFQDLDIFTTPAEKTGIGILDYAGIYSCIAPIGEKAPIAEGQINLTGFASGTYTLVLAPGAGNNVIWGQDFSCQVGTAGAFAIPAATVTGGQISFIHEGVVPVDPPVMVGAASVRTHAGAGSFGLPLNVSGTGNGSVEPRQGGVQQLVVTYDKALIGTPAVVLTASGLGGTGPPTLGTATLDGTGTVLTITMSGAVNKTCVNVAISGLTGADGSAAPVQPNVKVTCLVGDVDGDHKVLAADVSAIKSHTTGLVNVTAANFWYDIDATSKVQASDISLAKTLTAPLQTIGCAYP